MSLTGGGFFDKTEPMEIIKNIKAQWQEMTGETEETRLINAILTSTFIGDGSPSDECLRETKDILGGKDPYETIQGSFATLYDPRTKKTSLWMSRIPTVKVATRDVLRIMAYEGPLDNLVPELHW